MVLFLRAPHRRVPLARDIYRCCAVLRGGATRALAVPEMRIAQHVALAKHDDKWTREICCSVNAEYKPDTPECKFDVIEFNSLCQRGNNVC